MARTLVHRGPDDEGIWVDPERRCALSHRRLSVIDLSERARQPMRSQDGRLVLTYNGEIYNFLELRPEVEKRVPLRTSSDTEVLLELLREKGLAVLPDLDGMYAFAAFDTQSGELLLGRDPFGEKPLYYTHDAHSFSFASELSALQVLPEFDATVTLDAVGEYLALQYLDAPRTLYRGVKKLEPGHWLRVSPSGEVRSEPHFRFRPGVEPLNGRPIDDWADELEEILIRSLRRRLVADVPLGAFLSGGIDSSLTCALIRRRLDLPLRTFSLGFADSERSEHHAARHIAELLGTEHLEDVVTPQMADGLEVFAAEHDEPNGDASCWPVWRLSKLARRHVTVALSGDGGDELFGGYQRYLALPERIADDERGLGEWYFGGSNLLTSEAEIAQLLGCVPRGLAGVLEALRRELDWSDLDLFSRMRANDVRHYLPGAVLAKVDRMSMRHALELRSPFLSRELARFAERLPTGLLVHEGKGKPLLRHLLGRYLPAEIVDAPKSGFGSGMTQAWAGKGPARELQRCLDRPDSPLAPILDRSGLEAQLDAGVPVFRLSALLTLEGYLHLRPASLPEADAIPFSSASRETSLEPAQVLTIRRLASEGRAVDVLSRDAVPDWFAALPAGSRLFTPSATDAPPGTEVRRCDWAEGAQLDGSARAGPPRPRILLDWPTTLALPRGLMADLRGGDELWELGARGFERHRVDVDSLRRARLRARLRPLVLGAIRGPTRWLRRWMRPAIEGDEPVHVPERAARWLLWRMFSPGRLGRLAIPLFFVRDNRGHAVESRWTLQAGGGRRRELSDRWHLYEEDRPLSRPAAAKNAIRRLGRGRYRVERTNVFFSSSDGSSPLDNGRLYLLQPRGGARGDGLRRWLRDPTPTEWPQLAPPVAPTPDSALERFESLCEPLGELLESDPVGAGWDLPAPGEPPRVALFAASLGAGGAERQLTLLALEWVRRGAHVEVVLQEEPIGSRAHFLADLRHAGVRVHCTRPSLSARVPRDVFDAPDVVLDALNRLPGEVQGRTWRSYLLLRELRPHFVFSVLDTANVVSGLAGALAGVPATLMSARSMNPSGMSFHREWYRAGYRLALRSPRVALAANSRFGGDDYAAWLGHDPDRVTVIHNGLAPEAFEVPTEARKARLRAELSLDDGEPVVLGVMRFTAEKRPLAFVEAVARLAERRPDARALLVGDGPMADEVRAAVAEKGVEGRLQLLGARYDVRDLLAISRLAVVPSAFEGHPNVPLEAQAQGIPVVATRVGGVPETVIEGETALLVDAGDDAGLAACCAALLDDPARWRRFSEAGRAHAEAHFGVGRLVDDTRGALERLAAKALDRLAAEARA